MKIQEHVRLQEVLDKSCSLAAFKKNVRAEYKAGHRAKGTQHVAIAMSVLRRACGVDDDVKGSPKDIVQRAESLSRFVPLNTLVEKGVSVADRASVQKAERRDFVHWLNTLRKAADAASKEAAGTSRYVSGKQTMKLHALIKSGVNRSWPPSGDVRTQEPARPRHDKTKGKFGHLYREGQGRFSGLFEFGIDFATRMGIHGVGTSPSASTTAEKSRYNVQHTAQGIVSGQRRKKPRFGPKKPAKRGK